MDKKLIETEEQLSALTLGLLDETFLSSLESAMHNCTSSEDLREVEGELACLTPRELSEDQVDHLESVIMGSNLEQELQEYTPAKLDANVLANLEEMMESTSRTPAIIPFAAPKKKSRPLVAWGSVAAVILFGLVSVITWPSAGDGQQQVAQTAFPQSDEMTEPFRISPSTELTSETFKNIINASNEGMEISEGTPVHRVRIRYNEVEKVNTKDGKQFERINPREEVFFIPVETN